MKGKRGDYGLLTARMNWRIKEHPTSNGELLTLQKQTEYSDAFLRLCLHRGLDTKEKIDAFLQQDETSFHDPFLLYEMEKAIDRIKIAIEEGQAIKVFGDYDADGITSTAILVEALESLGANVSYYLPNRFSDGYGPNPRLFQTFIDEGTELILTCDNGVTGHESIALANQHGIDVIVSDHHEIPETLPDAYAVIHPKHPNGNYPFEDLSGAGVALKIAGALMERIPYEWLDLAAIGTVADLVSLTDENRWIVQQGILALRQTERLGLHLLFEKASIQVDQLDEESIGFIIGPRLNALGRLGDASPGVELLLSFDEERLEEVVAMIQTTNSKRQEIVAEIFESALKKVEALEELPLILLLAETNWHEGVLGIVASRLVEHTGRPTILLHLDEETGIAKGSARSIESVHIYEALSTSSDLLLKFGGHKMAAGMSVAKEQLDQLAHSLNEYAKPLQADIEKGETLYIDEILSVEEVNLAFLEELNLLKPFGTGNAKPVFGFRDTEVKNVRKIGADQQHLKMILQRNQEQLDVIGFNHGKLANHLTEQQPVSAVGELSVNTWKDISKPQLFLKDLKVNQVQYFDLRSSKLAADSLTKEASVYLFFNRKFFEQTANRIPSSSVAVLLESDDSIPPFGDTLRNLVLMDCPTRLDDLASFLADHSFENYYVYAYPIKPATLEGMPTKEQISHIYKYFYTRQNMDVRGKLDALAKYLQIHKNLLIFIISMFLEAKFVTIDNGVLNPVKNPQRIELTETETYQQRIKNIKAEKLFIYGLFDEVKTWLSEQGN